MFHAKVSGEGILSKRVRAYDKQREAQDKRTWRTERESFSRPIFMRRD